MIPPVPPSDDDLARLLAEGLGRRAGAPVDTDALVSGARAGAVRIRRRRTAALTAAALVVVVLPIGAVARQSLVGTGSGTSASSVEAADGAVPDGGEPSAVVAAPAASPEVPGRLADGESSAGSASPADVASPSSPSSPSPSPSSSAALAAKALEVLPRTATGAPAVPLDALLTPDALGIGARTAADTGVDGVAPAAPVTASCRAPLAPTGQAAGRSVTLAGAGATASTRTAVSTVRVFAGDGANGYLRRAVALGCLYPVSVPGADQALLGQGGPDRYGRAQWFAVARSGRAVTELTLAAPSGTADGRAPVTHLLTDAVARLVASGVPAAARTDPALS